MATNFIITSVGAAAAAGQANPNGIAVEITHFRVGTAYGYTPLFSDSALHGAELYQGQVAAIRQHSADTKAVIVELPAHVGPWDYGEIGLYLKTGELYALAAFDRPIHKYSATVDGIPHSPVFHCLIKMGPGTPANFVIDGPQGTTILEVAAFAYVTSPAWMPGTPNAVIVHETNNGLPSVLLYRNGEHTWVPANYDFVGTFNGYMSNNMTVVDPAFAEHASSVYGDCIIQDQWGRVRYTSYIQGQNVVLSSPIPDTPGFPSTQFTLYRKNSGSAGETLLPATSSVMWLWWSVNNFLGPAAARGQWGLNVTQIPIPTGTTPTDLEWSILTDTVNKIRYHQNPPFDAAGSTALVAPSRLDTLMFGCRFADLRRSISNMYTYARRVSGPMLESVQLAYSKPMNTTLSWIFSQISVNCTWASMPTANSFFNSGGFIDIRCRSGRGSFLEWVMFRTFSMLGQIRFSGDSTETMGPLGLKFERGDGVLTADGTLGWVGTSENIPKLMFTYYAPVPGREPATGGAGAGGRGFADESLILTLYATGITNGVNLRFAMHYTGVDTHNENVGVDQHIPTELVDPNNAGQALTNIDVPVLSTQPWTWLLGQRTNIYFISGRRNLNTLVLPPTPTMTIDTANTSWGVPIDIDANSPAMACVGSARMPNGVRAY